MNKPPEAGSSSSGGSRLSGAACPTDVAAAASGAHAVHLSWTPPPLPPPDLRPDPGHPPPPSREFTLQWRPVVGGAEGLLAPWSEARVKARRVVKVSAFAAFFLS
jgi:hypothetical protein